MDVKFYLTISRVLAYLSFISFIFAAAIVILTPPATGYEISIYQVYSGYLWWSLSVGIFAGMASLVVGASACSVLGFFPLALNNLMVVSLCLFRGYMVYGRFDTLGHVGYVKDIVETGHFSRQDFYPVLHILVVTLSQTTQTDVLTVMKFIPIIFSSFYMVSIYLLSRKVTQSWMQLIYIVMFSLPILLGPELPIFLPRMESFLLIPFVLYLMFRTTTPRSMRRRTYLPMLLITIFCVNFMHPLTSLILVLVLLSFAIPYKLLDVRALLFRKKGHGLESMSETRKLLFPSFQALAVLATFFAWMLNFSNFGERMRIVADWLIYQKGESQLELFTSLATRLSLEDSLEVVSRNLGQYLILVALGILASFAIMTKTKHFASSRLVIKLLFSCLFLEFLLITIAFFITNFKLEFNRGLVYVVLTAAFLSGMHYAPQKLGEGQKLRPREMYSFLIMILLGCSIVIGLFNIYPSPATKSYNQQVMYSEFRGWQWLVYNRSPAFPIDDIRMNQFWFAQAIMGTTGDLGSFRTEPSNLPPDHFDYTSQTDPNSRVNRYLVLGAISKEYYPALLPKSQEAWRFTESDFDSLLNLGNIRIYHNGEVEIYMLYVKN